MNMELKMRARRGEGWMESAGRCKVSKQRQSARRVPPASFPPSLLRRTSKHFFPDLKSLHELNPSALFLPPTQKADPGKVKLERRISPAHPSRVNLALRIFVSLSLCFYHVFIHCISSYMGRSLFLATSF